MDEPKAFEAMGLVLPSLAYVCGGMVFGMIGYAVFRRGRNTERSVLTWSGVALMPTPASMSATVALSMHLPRDG